MIHSLPELSYAYDALEPHIDAQTMELHHSKHHQGYVNNLNNALADHPKLQALSLEEFLQSLDTIPEDIRTVVRNNAGGHYNHSLFWENMGPDRGGRPEGDLGERIASTFNSFEEFRNQFSKSAGTVFGSGWVWLVLDHEALRIMTTSNQDSPISQKIHPLLGLDVWEHAYYLKYQNRRPEYIESWWNVVNWEEVSKRLADQDR